MAVLLAIPTTAMAWKPYTHNYIGDQAYRDATDDGQVTIGTHSYPLDAELVKALKRSRPYYNAGVVGPDGFPDIVYGQSVIHPEETGEWLSYLVDKAWKAQAIRGRPGYASEEERGRILAFTYGFLTHAAGDMWGHTLINDFADGVFPAFKDLTDPRTRESAARNALRHVVAEGYAGSATPGWDRSTDASDRATVCRPPVLATVCNDVSDDQTHAIQFAVPNEFIYDNLINPRVPLPFGTCGDNVDDDHDGTPDDGCPSQAYSVGAPEPQRGKMLDTFLDMQAGLATEAARLRYNAEDCPKNDPLCKTITPTLVVSTVRGQKILAIPRSRCAVARCTTSNADSSVSPTAAYLDAWIADISSGLKDWSTFSLAITQALFNPQARRDAQNAGCDQYPSEKSLSRAQCEQAIGAIDTIIFTSRDYFFDHLLSMLGAPDAVAWLADHAESVASFVSDLLDKILGPALNPFHELKLTIKHAIGSFVKESIRDATGVDPDQVTSFLKKPSRWMCGGALASFTLPVTGTIPATGLFTVARHQRLDAIMGLAPNHHTTSSDCSPLNPSSKYDFDPKKFAPIKNSITQAKLLLLNGAELNHAFGDVLYDDKVIKSPAQVKTYPAAAGDHSNIMYTPLSGTAPWLVLIDGDHAWRQNGLPRFAGPRGGTGQYPLWESCLLRPAFRALFTDWENNAITEQPNFPELGDPPSPDRSDPNEPGVIVRPADVSVPLLATVVVPRGSRFTVGASDIVFTDQAIKLTWKMYRPGEEPASVPPQAIANGGSFTLPPSATGDWIVEVVGTEGCTSRTRTQKVQIL